MLQEIGRASRNRNVCVVGDFNYRGINWERAIGDSDSAEFPKVVQDNLLKHVETEPTRGANILDLILTNDEYKTSEVEVGRVRSQ